LENRAEVVVVVHQGGSSKLRNLSCGLLTGWIFSPLVIPTKR